MRCHRSVKNSGFHLSVRFSSCRSSHSFSTSLLASTAPQKSKNTIQYDINSTITSSIVLLSIPEMLNLTNTRKIIMNASQEFGVQRTNSVQSSPTQTSLTSCRVEFSFYRTPVCVFYNRKSNNHVIVTSKLYGYYTLIFM